MSDSKATSDDVHSLNIYQKIAAITGEIGIVEKGGKNTEQKYDFIEYAAVAGKLRTLFSKYGVVIVPDMSKSADQQRVEITSSYGKKGVAILIDFTFDVVNADKPDDRFQVGWTGEAADFGDKATNKAATSAIKYYQMRQFNISEKGEDPDAEGPDRGDIKTTPPVAAAAPKTITIQDAMASAAAELARKGFNTPEERKNVIAKIAGVDDIKDVRPEHMNRVREVIETTSGRDLQGYLEVEQTELAPEVNQEMGNQLPQVAATKTQWTRIKMYMRGQGVAVEDIDDQLAERFSVPDPARLTYDEAEIVLTLLDTKAKLDRAEDNQPNQET